MNSPKCEGNHADRQAVTRPPAFQFYPRQFSGDDQVMCMDLEEIGAHTLLMCAAAASPERYRIDADEHAIRMRIRNPSDESWQRIKTRLLTGAWKLSADGKYWEQDGLRRTFEKQSAFSEKQRERVSARWKKNHSETIPDVYREPTETIPDAYSSSASASANLKPSGPTETHHKPAFSKPTLQELKTYCQEHSYDVDPVAFLAFYESNGWKVGKNPMKNWRAAVTTWQKRNNGATPAVVAAVPSVSRNLGAEVEKETRKLAAQGYTRNTLIEFRKLQDDLKSKMSPAEWDKWIRPLCPGCGDKKTLICFAPQELADEVIDRYAMLLSDLAAEQGFELCKVHAL